jgi:hypothetical protein
MQVTISEREGHSPVLSLPTVAINQVAVTRFVWHQKVTRGFGTSRPLSIGRLEVAFAAIRLLHPVVRNILF